MSFIEKYDPKQPRVPKGMPGGGRWASGIAGVVRQIADGAEVIRVGDVKVTVTEQRSANPSERGFTTIVAGPKVIQHMQGVEPTREAAVLEGLRQYREGMAAPKPKAALDSLRPKALGVPTTTPIRRSRVGNIDTDRLQRRHRWLTDHINDEDYAFPGGRRGFVERAAERDSIARELARRQLEITPGTAITAGKGGWSKGTNDMDQPIYVNPLGYTIDGNGYGKMRWSVTAPQREDEWEPETYITDRKYDAEAWVEQTMAERGESLNDPPAKSGRAAWEIEVEDEPLETKQREGVDANGTPYEDYLIDPFMFSFLEDRFFEGGPLGRKLHKADAIEMATRLLEERGFKVQTDLNGLDEEGTVAVISQAKYFKPPYNPDAAAFVSPTFHKDGTEAPGVAYVINPRHATRGVLIHELAHVIAGDPAWSRTLPEGVSNPHRIKWLMTYADLAEEEGFDIEARRLRAFGKSVNSEVVDRSVAKSDVRQWAIIIETGELVPLDVARHGIAKYDPDQLRGPDGRWIDMVSSFLQQRMWGFDPKPVVSRKVWTGEGDPDYTVDILDDEMSDEAVEMLAQMGEPRLRGGVEPYPGMEINEEQAQAASVVGAAWIDGGWPELRGRAMELRQNGTTFDVASSEEGEDEDLDTTIQRVVARMLSLIRVAPSSTVWRGMSVSDEVYDRLTTPGYEFDESLATGTGRRSLAEHFAAGTFETAEQMKEHVSDPRVGHNPVVLKITTNNVPIRPPNPSPMTFLDRAKLVQQAYLTISDERMISGRYRVMGVSNEDDYTMIELERVGD